jgi:hypothetical protein
MVNLLSKSRFQSGRQCHKRLWLEVHRRDLLEWDAANRAKFEEGNRFGELARELLGHGVLVDADHKHLEQAYADTSNLIQQPLDRVSLLFEPAFEHDGVRVRVDALQKRLMHCFSMIEVKSSTKVKPEHLWDCAIQTWVLRGGGFGDSLDEILLAHVDNSFVYTREGDYEGLLKQVDITSDVEELLPEVSGIVVELNEVAVGPQPEIVTGPHCTTPYECPFLPHCRASEPPPAEYPVALLPHAGKLVSELTKEGYRDLREVPLERLPSDIHRRIAEATRSGKPFVSPQLVATLDALPWPRHYLDFETITFTVPRWLRTRPWQQLPFQFSCHVEHQDGRLEHREFLDLSGDSPLARFVAALQDAVQGTGPILVWNQGFEAGRLRELAELFPDQSSSLLGIVDRMVDLLPIFRGHYYHPAMRGSWSIKRVLPTIAPELDYGSLEIGNGGDAQLGYLRAIAPETPAVEKERLRQQLLDYCGRDTLAMMRLAQWRPA